MCVCVFCETEQARPACGVAKPYLGLEVCPSHHQTGRAGAANRRPHVQTLAGVSRVLGVKLLWSLHSLLLTAAAEERGSCSINDNCGGLRLKCE